MTQDNEIESLGRGPRKILAGAGPHTPTAGMVFAYIHVQAGAFKAREKGKGEVNEGHLSTNGLYTGGSPYGFLLGVYGGNFDEVVGDGSFMAVGYMGTP